MERRERARETALRCIRNARAAHGQRRPALAAWYIERALAHAPHGADDAADLAWMQALAREARGIGRATA